MIKLSLEAIDRISSIGRIGVLMIDDKIYYYSVCHYSDIVGELLSKKILNLIGVNCPDYDYAILKNGYVKLSHEIPNFIDGEDLGVTNDNLYDIWRVLENRNFYSQTLMYDFIKIYLFDIFFLNDDRVARNWGIGTENEAAILYAIDNEAIFSRSYLVTVQSEFDKSQFQNKMLGEAEVLADANLNLKRFIETSDTEFLELLMEMYQKLTPEVVEDLYNELDNIALKEEDKKLYFADKEENLKLYRKNYKLIGDLIRERGMSR